MKQFLLACLLCMFTPLVCSCNLVLRVPPVSFKPSFYVKNGEWVGLSIDMAKKLFELTECNYSTQMLPFVRGLTHLERGAIDVMLHLSMTKERAKYVNFIGPMTYERLVFFTDKANSDKVEKLTDILLLNKPIAIQRGIHYSDEFLKIYQNNQDFHHKVVTVNNFAQLTKMLERGRISGFMFSSIHGRDLNDILEQFTEVEVEAIVLDHHPVYFGLSKKSIDDELLKRLQLSFEQLKKMPEFKFMLML